MANIGYSFLMVLAAFLWGSTFVAQIEGNDVGPFAFVCMRNFIATGVLFGLARYWTNSTKALESRKQKKKIGLSGKQAYSAGLRFSLP